MSLLSLSPVGGVEWTTQCTPLFLTCHICIFLVKVKLSCPRALTLSLSHVILYLFEGRIFMLIELFLSVSHGECDGLVR